MFRSKSAEEVFNRVKENQERPFKYSSIYIDGLCIPDHVKQLIFNSYRNNAPFALSDDEGLSICYFLPQFDMAVFCDIGKADLLTTQGAKEFEDAIKLALVNHRTFLGQRIIETQARYNEIVKQLNNL